MSMPARAPVPPGMPRLQRLDSNRRFDQAHVDALDSDPAYY